ncbi:MAG TPA: protein translocase subunit SecF [Dehalococcoidia bacterium]|nr:protein translocase subunit SecF [Dehalococcoidia bacterium]
MSTLDLVGARRWLFLGSAIAVIVSLVIIAIPPWLRPGIEFTSGTTTLIQFSDRVLQEDLRTAYAELDHPEARIQSTGSNQFLIRTSELDVPPGSFTEVVPEPEVAAPGPAPVVVIGTALLGAEDATGDVFVRLPSQGNPCVLGGIADTLPAGTQVNVIEDLTTCETNPDGEPIYRVTVGATDAYIRIADTHGFEETSEPEVIKPDQGERTVIEDTLLERFGEFEVLEFASVSPVVSRVAVRNAAVAVAVASLFIMAYIVFAFASVPKAFRYASCAIIAVLHDVIIVLGAFSLFGKLFGTEVNLMFVTGLLTVIGFSVHDSIVVFDRIRENVMRAPDAPLAQNVNAALLQTLARSFNTSVTLLLVVLAMLLLGGVTIQSFLLVILVGVIAGTYSSVGLAAQLLVSWDEGELGRWLTPWRRRDEEPSAAV